MTKKKDTDDVCQLLDDKYKSMDEIDKEKIMRILGEIFNIDEKSLIPIRGNATLYGKISSRVYSYGVLGCAALSVFFILMSTWFQSLQSISFLFLFLFYICFFIYNFYDLLSYRDEIDYSVFSVKPYFSKLKSLSDIYSPKFMELSEKSIEIALLGLQESYSNLSRFVPNIMSIFRFVISFPGMFASYFLFFQTTTNPWVIAIAYGNLILLFLKVIKHDRPSLLVTYDYAIAITEISLTMKSKTGEKI